MRVHSTRTNKQCALTRTQAISRFHLDQDDRQCKGSPMTILYTIPLGLGLPPLLRITVQCKTIYGTHLYHDI